MIRIARENETGLFEFVNKEEFESSELAKRGLKKLIASGTIEEGSYLLVDVKKRISAKAETLVKIKEVGEKKTRKKVKEKEPELL